MCILGIHLFLYTYNSMNYNIIEEHYGIESSDLGNHKRSDPANDLVENLDTDFEVDYAEVFTKIAQEQFPDYEHMVPLLANLGYLIDANVTGLHDEHTVFAEEDKELLTQIYHKALHNQETIEQLYVRIYNKIKMAQPTLVE